MLLEFVELEQQQVELLTVAASLRANKFWNKVVDFERKVQVVGYDARPVASADFLAKEEVVHNSVVFPIVVLEVVLVPEHVKAAGANEERVHEVIVVNQVLEGGEALKHKPRAMAKNEFGRIGLPKFFHRVSR